MPKFSPRGRPISSSVLKEQARTGIQHQIQNFVKNPNLYIDTDKVRFEVEIYGLSLALRHGNIKSANQYHAMETVDYIKGVLTNLGIEIEDEVQSIPDRLIPSTHHTILHCWASKS